MFDISPKTNDAVKSVTKLSHHVPGAEETVPGAATPPKSLGPAGCAARMRHAQLVQVMN